MPTLTLPQVFALPEMASSHAREVSFAVQWFTQSYGAAKAAAELAWKVYDDAIEAQQPHSEICELGVMAQIFDDIRVDAWRRLDIAKRDYLLMMN